MFYAKVYPMIVSHKVIMIWPKVCFLMFFLSSIVSCADENSMPSKIEASAETACGETIIATERGSVGFMKNLAESEDSIRAIADKQLRAALESGASDKPSSPSEASDTKIIYRVKPIEFLPKTEQNQICLQLEEETSVTPLKYGPNEFTSVTGLNDWIMSLTRGNGMDGKLLYKQCGSNCSPRYTFSIDAKQSNYIVNTEVLCGLARDTASDLYELSTALVEQSCASD